MPRRYEIVYIFDGSLEEKEIDSKLDQFHSLLKTKAVKTPVLGTNHWGKRTLAYQIRKSETGHFVVVDLETSPETLVEFERVLKLDAQVLRYLIVLHEENPEEPLQEDKPADESQKRDESRDSGREYRDRDRPRVFDYKDERSLSRFTTDTGKILPRRVSGNTARQQRKLSIAIKRARFLALITATGVRSR